MKDLKNNGIYPSRKAVKRVYGKNIIFNDYFKKIWIETLEELGLTTEICDYDNYM